MTLPTVQGQTAMAKQCIGVAVIGCGYWGVNYIRIFGELPLAKVVAICDSRDQRLAELQSRFPNAHPCNDISQVLAMADVDVVAVCTTAETHFEIARQALLAGKHVLIEKPMTTKSADAADLHALASKLNLTLMVGHTFVYNNGVRKLKEYIENGSLGRVYYMYARRTNLGPIRSDVNAIWDLATHDVAIFNYLLDAQPTWVSAVTSRVLNNVQEDVGFVSLGYGSGVVAHIHASWADPNKVREVVVVGSNQRIIFNDIEAVERVRVFEKGVSNGEPEADGFVSHQLLIRDGDIISPRIEPNEPLKSQCAHFLDCVISGATPQTGGENGLRVVKVMEAVSESARKRGAPVTIES